MTRAGMVIGLGGLGTQVAHRIRGVLTAGPGGKVPENIRLLAFDLLRPVHITARLGQPFYFLVRLPIGDSPLPATRGAARDVLLQDLQKGSPSSLVMRSLSLNLEALRRSGASTVDVFLVTSSFGSTGSAWLLDMAYLCHYFGKSRIAFEVHALLITPEACESTFPLTPAHRLTNFAVLKELESLQKERDWGSGFSIYGGNYLAGMPGLLTAAPFATVQVIDGQNLGGSIEQTAIPAAADGILCQLDEQVGQILRQSLDLNPNARRGPTGKGLFSSFGIQSLVRPRHLMVESGAQHAILGLVESLLPILKDPNSSRPQGLEPGRVLVPSDPYGDIQRWLGETQTSGVLTDVMYQVGLTPAMRQDWLLRLAAREINDWKAVLFQVKESADLIPAGGVPETLVPFIQGHFHAFLCALANKALELDSHPAGVLEYLTRIEQTLTDYVADLSSVEETLKRLGKHSESEPVAQSVADNLSDWEKKRASNWARLFPQRVEEAQERYILAKQASVNFQQREALLGGARKSASLMLTLTRKLLDLYRYYTAALALSRDSLYNSALDQHQRLARELQDERAVRSQKVVIDESYEERQSHTVFERLLNRLFPALQACLLDIETHVDWHADSLRVQATLAENDGLDDQPDLGTDLADLSREPEETAAFLAHWLGAELGGQIADAFGGNSILNFINYINPSAEKLGVEMSERSAPLAQTLIPPATQVSFLFSPDPDAANRMPYVRDFVYELYQQLGELYQVDSGDPDRMILFRRYDGLTLDNLLTYHQSIPEKLVAAEIKPYVLWIL